MDKEVLTATKCREIPADMIRAIERVQHLLLAPLIKRLLELKHE